jgi:hypothetical protein
MPTPTPISMRVLFIGNARCYHTVDLCRSLRKNLPERSCLFFTDLIESEGHPKIIRAEDSIKKLIIIDRLLLKRMTRAADIWRNLVKFVLAPLQAGIFRVRVGSLRSVVIHAHTFYYGFLCRIAGVPFLFTPQGGELTERPYKSAVYRRLMRWTLAGARHTFVDSRRMLSTAKELGCERVSIFQYGIDTTSCSVHASGRDRWRVVSNRGITKNYRIDVIQAARDREAPRVPLTFFYPFWELEYKDLYRARLARIDQDRGRVSKGECYTLYGEALLVVSIPLSDSSPRSVYEAIFCGAPVVTVASEWVDDLPASMRERVLVVDPESNSWLTQALAWARSVSQASFVPCDVSRKKYDQYLVARDIVDRFYFISG